MRSMWVARAPGRTWINSVRRAKQPCLVLMDFSFIWRWRAFTMLVTWPCSRDTGPSSASILLGSWETGRPDVLDLACFRRA